MSNVATPWRPTGCACERFRRQLRSKGSTWQPPELEGHIFFTGREYCGPHAQVFAVANTNIPNGTNWDWSNVLRKEITGLPVSIEKSEVDMICKRFNKGYQIRKDTVPTTTEVYSARKVCEGLVIGPLDKNNGEFWGCCPHLYEKALGNMYIIQRPGTKRYNHGNVRRTKPKNMAR